MILYVAGFLEPHDFYNLSKTCKRFRYMRNDPYLLQQFNDVSIDQHLLLGHLSLLRYKHQKGQTCTNLVSFKSISYCLEVDLPLTLKYLLDDLKKVITFTDCYSAGKNKNKGSLNLFIDHLNTDGSLDEHLILSCFENENDILFTLIVHRIDIKYWLPRLKNGISIQFMHFIILNVDTTSIFFKILAFGCNTSFSNEQNERMFVIIFSELNKNLITTSIAKKLTTKSYMKPQVMGLSYPSFSQTWLDLVMRFINYGVKLLL